MDRHGLRAGVSPRTVPRMDDRRWGFDEADDWEYEQLGGSRTPEPDAPAAPAEDGDTVTGRDDDRVVEVVVSFDAEVRAVRLAPRWRHTIEPWTLRGKVVAAANAATMQALAYQVEHPAPAAEPEPAGPSDNSPLTNQDVTRLLDAVDAQMRQFSAQLSAVADDRVSVRSSNGHVEGAALRGQVLDLEIDPSWVGQARSGEIEDELTEVLRGLHRASTPGDLAAGPSGGPAAELMALAADPVQLMRRLGLPADGGTNG